MIIKRPFVAFFLLIVGCCFLGTPIEAANLHLIMVGDTLDVTLKESVLVDLKNIDALAEEISAATGLVLKRYSFKDERATATKVLDKVKGLKTEMEDMVLFYFSGHGYRTASKELNPWPSLYFTSNQSGLDLQDVADIIKSKDAHFSVVLADCCNNVIPDSIAPEVSRARTLTANDSLIRVNYRKLFIETDGQVIASGSKAGQYSWGTSESGGRFSHAFFNTFESIVKRVETDLLSWQLVLDMTAYETQKAAQVKGQEQDPAYIILK